MPKYVNEANLQRFWDNIQDQIGSASQEQVNAWLDNHPEATTTVQDGSIATAKLADGAVTDAKLAQTGGVLERVANLERLAEYNDLNDLESLWEQGTLNTTTGEPSVSTTRIRTSDFIDLQGIKQLIMSVNSGYKFACYAYDNNKAFISSASYTTWRTDELTINVPSDVRYIKPLLSNESNTAIATSEYTNLLLIGRTYLYGEYSRISSDINALYKMESTDILNGVVWEVGSLSGEAGLPIVNATRIRTAEYIDIASLQSLTISIESGYKYMVFWYDSDNNMLSINSNGAWQTLPQEFTKWSGAVKVKIVIANSGNTTANVSFASNLVVTGTPRLVGTVEDNSNVLSSVINMSNDYYSDLLEGAVWVIGSIVTETGANLPSTTRIRTNSYIDITDCDNFAIEVDDGYKYIIFWYDSESDVVNINNNGVFQTIPQHFSSDEFKTATMIRLVVADINNRSANLSFADHVRIHKSQAVDKLFLYYNALRETELVVMTFNSQRWTGLNSNLNLLKNIIDKYEPDIIALQEFVTSVNAISIYKTLFANYPYYFYYTGATNPICIVSKYEFNDATGVVYQAQGTYEDRGYILAHITVNDNTVAIFDTHLEILPNAEDSRTIRTAQAAELLSAMQNEEYAICCGDFNSADCFNTEGLDYLGSIKPFLDMGYHSANCSDQHGFLRTWYNGNTTSSSADALCIDQIITTSNVDIDTVIVNKDKNNNDNTSALDHFPMVAYCHING